MNHGLPPALALLAKVKNPVADAALVAALPYLSGGALGVTIDLLLKRGNAAALAELLRQRRSMPGKFDVFLLPRMNDLHSALGNALAHSDVEERLSAVSFVGSSNDSRCADLLVDAIRHTCPRTRQAAADALLMVTQNLLSRRCLAAEEVLAFQEALGCLTTALENALQGWRQHHQPAVLRAAMRLAPAMNNFLAQAAGQTGTALSQALQKTIANAAEPQIAEAVMRSLAIPSLRAAAANAIGRAMNCEFIAEFLGAAWLVADSGVRHGCLFIRKSKWEPEWLQALARLDESDVAAAAEFVGATGGSVEGKMDLFRQMLGSSAEAVRRAAFWQVIRHASEPAAQQLLETVAVRDDEEFGPAAKLACSRWGTVSPEEPGQQKKSHPEIAEAVRQGLSSPSAIDRVRALIAVESAATPAEFKNEVLRLLRDGSPAVRSAAVALMPKLQVSNPAYLLRQSLGDSDPRVQANAVEMADALRLTELLPLVHTLIAAADARLRANAIKFCVQEGVYQAGDALIAMLEDPLPAHRRSALWVADRLQLVSLKQRIETLSAADSDETVRRYAREIAAKFSQAPLRERSALAIST